MLTLPGLTEAGSVECAENVSACVFSGKSLSFSSDSKVTQRLKSVLSCENFSVTEFFHRNSFFFFLVSTVFSTMLTTVSMFNKY